MISSINTNYSAQNTKPSFSAQMKLSKLAEDYIIQNSKNLIKEDIETPTVFIYHLKNFFKQLTSDTEGILRINKIRKADGISFSYEPAGKIENEIKTLFSDIIDKPNYTKHPEYQWTLDDITEQLFPSFEKALAKTMALFKQRPWDKVALNTSQDPILSIIARNNHLVVDSKAAKKIETYQISNIQRAMYKEYRLKMQRPADREKMSVIMSHNLKNTFAQLDEIVKARKDFATAVQQMKEQLADAFGLKVDKTGKIIPPSSPEAQLLLRELTAKQFKM